MSTLEITAAVAAVLVAAYVVWRWRKLSLERRALGVVVVLALGVYASGVLSTLPDPKTVIEDIAEALGAWTYAFVAVAAFLETGAFVGLVAPGETIVIAAGVVAGQGTISLLPLIGIVWLSAVLGDTTSFFIGKRLGRAFLEKHGPRFKITEQRLRQVESYFDRHGGKTILIGRFIGLVRALAPFIAGSSGLAYRRFIPYSVVGTGLWASLFCTLGYLFWRSFDRVAHLVGQAIFGFGLTVAVIVGVVVAYRRRAEIGEWFARTSSIRSFARCWRSRGPFTAGWCDPSRRWPCRTCGFSSTGSRRAPSGSSSPPSSRSPAWGSSSSSRTSRNSSATQARRPSTRNCSTWATASATTCSWTSPRSSRRSGRSRPSRRSWSGPRSCCWCASATPRHSCCSLGSCWSTSQWTSRRTPRAPAADRFTRRYRGIAYPSGHAAYATAWIAVAVALTRRLRLVTSGVLVFIALAIAAAVGVSRVYLRAHWGSDVAGGWGLGAGIFATLAAIALVVEYFRHNGGEQAAESPESVAVDRTP